MLFAFPQILAQLAIDAPHEGPYWGPAVSLIPEEEGRFASWAFEGCMESVGLPYRATLETSTDNGEHWRACAELPTIEKPGMTYDMVEVQKGTLTTLVRVCLEPIGTVAAVKEVGETAGEVSVAGSWKILSNIRFKIMVKR